MGTMVVEALSVGPFQCNAFILRDADTKDAVIIDPGDDVSTILKILKRDGLGFPGTPYLIISIYFLWPWSPLFQGTI